VNKQTKYRLKEKRDTSISYNFHDLFTVDTHDKERKLGFDVHYITCSSFDQRTDEINH